jgi:hypothetical protein
LPTEQSIKRLDVKCARGASHSVPLSAPNSSTSRMFSPALSRCDDSGK